MKFVKMHGTGNDFVLVDARQMDANWPGLAQAVCDRHYGIGADGLILVLPSSAADLRMRTFNPDGSEAEMCGNGIRCFAKFALEEKLTETTKDVLTVETLAGLRLVRPIWGEGGVVRATVSMGMPRFQAKEVPVAIPGVLPEDGVTGYPLSIQGWNLSFTCLSMGNPHAVCFIEEPVGEFPLEHIGPLMERHQIFPQRVNFSVARALAHDRIEARVWERGAGLTLACGTAVCAIMCAARVHHLVGEKVDITMPGGVLALEWDGIGEVVLTGPVERVFAGEWEGRVP